jgi:hypothetical protein
MALYLLQRKAVDGVSGINGVDSMIIEADSAAVAKQVAAAQVGGDSGWDVASDTAIAAGVASDYEGYTYRVKVSGGAGAEDLHDVSYTGVGSDTVDLIGAALAELLRGSAVDAAIADDGGAYTDETTEANEDTGDDMTLLPAVPVDDDAYIIGMSHKFDRVLINVTTAGTGTYAIEWQYWDGTQWTALSDVTDDTTGFTVAGLNDVTWTVPSDWATTTINSQGPFYFVRANFTDTSIGTVPAGGQAYAGDGTRAAYDTGTNVLTVAAIADGIGDKTLAVEAKLPDADEGISALVGTITDGGIAAAVLTVVLEDETAIPAILAQL